MKLVSVRDLRQRSSEIWGLLREEGDLVVTSNGNPIALLSDISESNLEEYLRHVRRIRATLAANSIQERSRKLGLDQMPAEEIDAEIKEARRNRPR
ncbi:MAG: type II toxin-antitoxin system Phd/YefM family antitoxin [Syntrophomonadaceae bacterium]|jgi:antitoxin (DNA-binding transcriptional repressor) of toxin-antitoxin stability system|nr:type II toxin-antitoxin system Phd/YefM family antitoxin [Syntrophomonadaceae bacterium]